jgi:hypothetical protein
MPPADGDPPLWHVLHTDGDEEDLDEEEVLEALVEEVASAVPDAPVDAVAPTAIPASAVETESRKRKATTSAADDEDAEAEFDENNSDDGQIEEPDIVNKYSNNSRAYQSVKPHQIGLGGFKSEVLRLQGTLLEGLKKRGSSFNREGRKVWETSIRDATSVLELRSGLLELEAVVHEVRYCAHLTCLCKLYLWALSCLVLSCLMRTQVQAEDDLPDDEVKAIEKKQEKKEMAAEGWLFDPTASAHIGKR